MDGWGGRLLHAGSEGGGLRVPSPGLVGRSHDAQSGFGTYRPSNWLWAESDLASL